MSDQPTVEELQTTIRVLAAFGQLQDIENFRTRAKAVESTLNLISDINQVIKKHAELANEMTKELEAEQVARQRGHDNV
jgi:hypothetical protein